MLISVFGTPSPLTYWGFHFINTAMREACGDSHFISCMFIDDLRTKWEQRRDRSVIFGSECPDSHVSNLFMRYPAPIYIFVEDIFDVVGFVMASRSFNIFDAIRFSSQSICSLGQIIAKSPTSRIHRGVYSADVGAFARQFLVDINGSVDEALFGQIMSRLIPNYQIGQDAKVGDQILAHFKDARPPGHFAAGLTDEMRMLVETSLKQYEPILFGQTVDELVWPRDLFPHSDPSGRFQPGPIDLVGPMRFLTWGPYMHLPKGEWIATIEIEVAENYSGNTIQVDALAGAVILSAVTAELPAQGVYTFDMNLTINEPVTAIEIRSFLQSGAIEGRFALRTVRLRSSLVAEGGSRLLINNESTDARS